MVTMIYKRLKSGSNHENAQVEKIEIVAHQVLSEAN